MSTLIVYREVDTDFVEPEAYTILGFSFFKKKNKYYEYHKGLSLGLG